MEVILSQTFFDVNCNIFRHKVVKFSFSNLKGNTTKICESIQFFININLRLFKILENIVLFSI